MTRDVSTRVRGDVDRGSASTSVGELAKVEKEAANINANEAAALRGFSGRGGGSTRGRPRERPWCASRRSPERRGPIVARSKASVLVEKGLFPAATTVGTAGSEAPTLRYRCRRVEAPPEILPLDLDPAARAAALAHPPRRKLTGGSTADRLEIAPCDPRSTRSRRRHDKERPARIEYASSTPDASAPAAALRQGGGRSPTLEPI